MAIAFDAQSASSFSSGTTNTFSHTCSGSDRILYVGVYDGLNNVTGVTYNGTSMTLVNSFAMTGSAAGQYIRLYQLVNPSTGTNNVVITCSVAGNTYGNGISYTGANQTGQPDANNTNGASTGTSLTTSVTTVADNCWIVGYAYMAGTITAGTNTTLRSTNASGVLASFDTNSAQTPAGSKSVQTNSGTNGFNGHVIASFSPSVSSGSTQGMLMMF